MFDKFRHGHGPGDSRERGMRGGRHGPRGWGEHGHGWGRRHGGGRFFDQGDLRLVVLSLLSEQPRHGYDLIKEIERLSGAAYAPSPGVIYPLLTMLEEMGHAEVQASEGAKKLYALTDEGRAELAANKAEADALLARLALVKERAGARSPQVMRAWENLHMALRYRFEREVSDEQATAIAAALDTAAQAVERS
jgi:DNA-binding PadR family transcriptional regulator